MARRRSNARVMRLGAISLVVLLVVMAAAFNLQKFPGFRGTTYHAEFTDASGLHKGNMVQVAGVRVGRVNALHISGDHVTVDFDVKDAELGSEEPRVGRGAQPARGEVPRDHPEGLRRDAGRRHHPGQPHGLELRHRRHAERADHPDRGHRHPEAGGRR